MTERPIEEEVRQLAEQIATGPDDVAEFGAIHAATYRRERLIALGLLGVDAMVRGEDHEIYDQEPLLVATRERLRSLLKWARETGRMPGPER